MAGGRNLALPGRIHCICAIGFLAPTRPSRPALDPGGLELALVARDQTERTAATVMYATAAAILALGSTATGFFIGWALALVVVTVRRSGAANTES